MEIAQVCRGVRVTNSSSQLGDRPALVVHCHNPDAALAAAISATAMWSLLLVCITPSDGAMRAKKHRHLRWFQKLI